VDRQAAYLLAQQSLERERTSPFRELAALVGSRSEGRVQSGAAEFDRVAQVCEVACCGPEDAIAHAETVLPGTAAPEGEIDPRWQAIMPQPLAARRAEQPIR
jgi:hypothetical protein